jgi:hypothetical protein
VFTGKSALLSDAVRSNGVVDDGLIAHGGASPVPLDGSSPGLFLASFHTISSPVGLGHNKRKYQHYLYLFEPESFDVVAVSAPLPLVGHPDDPGSTFLSAIVPLVDNNNSSQSPGLAVLYGSADRESRVLFLSSSAIEQLFSHADLATFRGTTNAGSKL